MWLLWFKPKSRCPQRGILTTKLQPQHIDNSKHRYFYKFLSLVVLEQRISSHNVELHFQNENSNIRKGNNFKKSSKTSQMCHLDCLKFTNYVVLDMDLRISCEFQTFIDTSQMVGVYVGYFEICVVMLSFIWIYKISCELQTFIDTSPMLGVYLWYFEFPVVVGSRTKVSTTTTWSSNA